MKPIFLPIVVLLVLVVSPAGRVQGELVINESLDTLAPGTHRVAGSTEGAGSEADYFGNLTTSSANWGEEYVYEFSLPQPSIMSLRAISLVNDPDFFISTSARTEVVDSKTVVPDVVAAFYLDSGLVETPRLIGAGTQYLTAASFSGFDGGSLEPQDAEYDVEISVSLPQDLGTVAAEGQTISIDTFESNFDTVLSVWDESGALLAQNDDANGTTQSEATLSNVEQGQYYVGLTGFHAEMDDDFFVDASNPTDDGDFVLNLPTTSVSGTLDPGVVEYFTFEVTAVPEPSPLLAALIGSATCLLRLRKR